MSTLLKEIPKSELPRERLVALGREKLSNEELLSILLRTGVRGHPVSDLSRRVLSMVEDIKDLKSINLNTLKTIKGLGSTKGITILAALELGRRVYEDATPKEKMKLKTPTDTYRYFAKYIKDEPQENFMAIFVDNHRRYISHKILFKGTLAASLVHPREVFKSALLENAAAVIVMHNHPSGISSPSASDDDTTAKLIEAGNMIGIPLIDHIVVGDANYYSYTEEGRLRHE